MDPQSTVDVSGILSETLKTTPIAAILMIIVWRLWAKLTEKEAEQKAMIEKHEQIRADQQKLMIELHERSITSNTLLTTAIDKLRLSVCDQQDALGKEFVQLNQKLDRPARNGAPRPAKSQATA